MFWRTTNREELVIKSKNEPFTGLKIWLGEEHESAVGERKRRNYHLPQSGVLRRQKFEKEKYGEH